MIDNVSYSLAWVYFLFAFIFLGFVREKCFGKKETSGITDTRRFY